jgi:ABC-type glycerol-3-phosphate transport system substrate-binding protein
MLKSFRQEKWVVLVIISGFLLSACSSLLPSQDVETFTFAVDETELEYFLPLVKEYNQLNSDAKVILLPLDYGLDQSNSATLTAFADAFLLPEGYAIVSGPGSYFLDLQPLIESDSTFDSEDFWPGSLSACQDEQSYLLGIPLSLKIQGIFYDPAAFDVAGISHPRPGWDLDEFQQVVFALADSTEAEEKYNFRDGNFLDESILAPLVIDSLVQNGNSINPDELASALQWYVDLSRSGAISPVSSVNQSRSADLSENKPAMWVGELGSYMPGTSDNALLHGRFIPFPVSSGEGEQNTTPFSAACAVISTGTNHSQAAWEWLSYLSHHAGSARSQTGWDSIPARRPVTESHGYWQRLPSGAESAVRFALEHLNSQYSNLAAHIVIQNALLKSLRSNVDLKETLAAAQAQLLAQPASSRHPVDVMVAPPPEGMDNLTLIKFAAISVGSSDSQAVWGTDEDDLRVKYRKLHPGVVVLPVIIENPDRNEDIYSYLSENSDCFQWYNYESWDAQTTGQLLDLTPFWDSEAETFRQDYTAGLIDRYRYKGQLFGLPGDMIPRVMVYNADLLKSLGLEEPELGWSFDQFIQLASQVASTNQRDNIYGYLSPIGDEFLLRGRGTIVYDLMASPPAVSLNSPEMINTLVWLKELTETRVIYPYGKLGTEVFDLVKSGRVAFWTSLAGNPGGGYTLQELTYRIGELPFPAGIRLNSSIGPQRGYFISRNNLDPRACWEWIKFLSEQPSTVSGVPARRSVSESAAWVTRIGEVNANVYRVAVQQMNQYETSPAFMEGPILTLLRQAIDVVLQGEDPNLALTEAQGRAEAYLDCIIERDLNTLTYVELNDLSSSCSEQVDDQDN